MQILSNPQIQIVLQLILSVILGGLLGLEREYQKKAAGLRTYSLVCLGSALFTIISMESFRIFAEKSGISFDPSRTIAGVVLGIGFIGAGLIIHRGFRVEGLTTAAGIWVAAAIGVAIAIKLYLIALFAAFLTLGIFNILGLAEEKFFKKNENEND